MFCGECGTKNKKGSTFCEKCGAKLEVEEKTTKKEETKKEEPKKVEVKTEPKKERKPLSKQNKIIIGVVACVVAILVAGYMYLGSIYKPEKIAIKYFKAYASKDANKISKIVKFEESDFVNKKLLKDALKEEERIELENYTIDNNTTKEKIAKVFGVKDYDDLSKTITIKYIKKGSSKEYYKTIKLVKSKNKKFIFFDNWKVDSSDLIAKDYSISVPKDSKVKLDGVSLGKEYKSESSYSSYNVYKIPSILKGSHKITVTLKSGLVLTGDAKISGNYGSFSSSSLKIDSKNEKKFINEIKEKITLIYNAAIEDKSFDDIKDNFDEDYRDDFENIYNTVKQNALSSYNKLKELKVKDIEIRYFNTYDEDMRYTLNFKYDYKVEYKNGDETKEYSKTDKVSTIFVTYKLGKNVKLSKIDSLPTYFSHYSY